MTGERYTESTSAALRRVEQERDQAVANFHRLQVLAREDFEKCTAVIKQTGDDRDLARAELASARTELDAVRTARDNLDRARSWIVARDGGRACIRCDQEIRRGEAYQPHNAAADELEHIHCPDGRPE